MTDNDFLFLFSTPVYIFLVFQFLVTASMMIRNRAVLNVAYVTTFSTVIGILVIWYLFLFQRGYKNEFGDVVAERKMMIDRTNAFAAFILLILTITTIFMLKKIKKNGNLKNDKGMKGRFVLACLAVSISLLCLIGEIGYIFSDYKRIFMR